MKTKILKWLFIFVVMPAVSVVAFVASARIRWDYVVCFLAALFGISVISFFIKQITENKTKTFFKWVSIITFIPPVCFIIMIRMFFWEISNIIKIPRLNFLYIEIKTNQSENERTVYYVWSLTEVQKYKIKDGVIYDYCELPPLKGSLLDKRNDLLMNNSICAVWDLRKTMKPYRWLPTRTKIDNNAAMIIQGRGLRGFGDYLFWSGAIEDAPDGILPIIKILDKQTELITPTNGMMFVQAIPNQKSSPKNKRMLTSDFSKEGQEIINNAYSHPYRLQLVNRYDSPIPLVENFRPINTSYDGSFMDTKVDIHFLPYSFDENGNPHPIFEQTAQGVQP